MPKKKRDKETITLGSGKLYYQDFADTVPDVAVICTPEHQLGHIKGGAALEYTEETYEESDDLGLVKKIITTKEEAVLRAGLITWCGDTINVLVDRSTVSEAGGKRTTKIGGAGNAKNKSYVLCFHHEDKTDGDVWVTIVGRNTAGLKLEFKADGGTAVEPSFKALPQDDQGTLIQLIEEIPGA